MKRLSGWDAVLLYSEAPNVHMHTIKVAVIELDEDSRGFDDRRVSPGHRRAGWTSWSRSAISSSTSRSSSTTRCGGRTATSISTTTSGHGRLAAPGGRRELDEAIGQIASTPLDRDRPLWEMYFVEGLANERGSRWSARSTTHSPMASPRRT